MNVFLTSDTFYSISFLDQYAYSCILIPFPALSFLTDLDVHIMTDLANLHVFGSLFIVLMLMIYFRLNVDFISKLLS